MFDTIDPKRYVLLGVQRYATVEQPHLKGFGWYVEGMGELYRALRRHGIRVMSQLDELADGDEPPTAAGSAMPLFFSLPEDVGLRYEFFPAIPFPARSPDCARLVGAPGVGRRSPRDRVLLAPHRADRSPRACSAARRSTCSGSEVVHEGRDGLRGTTGTYVNLADSILEYAVPDAGTAGARRLAQGTTQTTPTTPSRGRWPISTVPVRHLEVQGVRIEARSDDTVVTEPATSLGDSVGLHDPADSPAIPGSRG